MNRSKFHCRCCGACCWIKDGIVRVSDAEISRIAAYLGMDEAEFIAGETELAPDRKGLMLKSRTDGACVYLDENNLCRLNPLKPDKCRISVGAPGVYRIHFVSKNGRVSDWFDNEYRIDANNGKVEVLFDKWLVRVPPGTVDISCFGKNEGGAYLAAICEDGTKIKSDRSIPAGEDKYQYAPLGSVDSKGVFHPFSPESCAVDSGEAVR